MLSINMEDVFSILKLCAPYLIFFAVILVIALGVMIGCKNMVKSKKYLVRAQAGMAILTALIITVNMVCLIPLSNIISLAMGDGTITEETIATANVLCEDIAKEGIVLLKNDDGVLPFDQSSKLNVFGWGSTNPCYGGTGSGALSDSYPTVSLIEGLQNAEFTLNTQLSDFYTAYRDNRPKVGMWEQDWTLPEPTADTYSQELIDQAKSFSDAAVIVITRVGGEGADLPMDISKVTYTDNSTAYKDFEDGAHYLELSKSERNMIDLVCENFDDVVLVYNGANAFELDFTNEYEQIKSVLWCPGTGQSGFNALGAILSGQVNPSGKTTDTFVKDLTMLPQYKNIGNFTYDNMLEFASTSFDGEVTSPTFVNYVEGIYAGYRFYETAAEEGLIDYDSHVLFPFGYGLSYTTFAQEMGELRDDGNGTLSVDVVVTNTGAVPGKDVVELYYNPPYTDGGIEKASVNLAAFDKTSLLEAGESETLTLTFAAEDMASYDTYGAGCYVLEAGDYEVSIRTDSHTVIDTKTYNVASSILYNEQNKRNSDLKAAVNEFAEAEGDVTYLSRADGFANFAEATAAPDSLTMSDAHKATFVNNSNYDAKAHNVESDVAPVTGASNGKKLADMRGLSYDDPSWEPLLDQLTVKDMNEMIAVGGYQTVAVSSVDKYATIDCDGPASINNNFTGVGSIGFPAAVMIACTWNEEIGTEFGESIGKMADEMGVSGWYAPAMNIHRSAFSGRNFEYYSEDGFLSGKMAANAIKGAETYGVYAYIKHYALNDQEINRNSMLCTWSNEQAIREIYLKPFEIAVKEGGAKAVMSSFNYVGTEYAAANVPMQVHVLRDEWGFEGLVLTDYFAGYGYQNADQLIRGGNDCMLATYDTGSNYVKDTTSATSLLAMRQSSKNIMYTVVNSRAYAEENVQTGMMAWQIWVIVIDVLLVAALIAIEVLVIRKGYAKRKETIEIETSRK